MNCKEIEISWAHELEVLLREKIRESKLFQIKSIKHGSNFLKLVLTPKNPERKERQIEYTFSRTKENHPRVELKISE